MSGSGRLSTAGRLRALFGRRAAEHSVRELIAELVQEAAEADGDAGAPEDPARRRNSTAMNAR